MADFEDKNREDKGDKPTQEEPDRESNVPREGQGQNPGSSQKPGSSSPSGGSGSGNEEEPA